MSSGPFRVVHVDDQPSVLTQVKELLEDDEDLIALGGVEVTSFDNFADALGHLDQTFADIVILDVMKEHGVTASEPQLAGRDAFDQLRAKVFVPVIFYTGFGHRVTDLEDELQLLRVVTKGNAERLLEGVKEVIEEGLPTLNRGLVELLREVQRAYMWEFVAHHWSEFQSQTDTMALAHLLVRRFALSLSAEGAAALVASLPLGGTNPPQLGNDGKVHPISMYVMPPVPGAVPKAGDVRRGQIDGGGEFWAVLTPSCDFAQGKADTVLLAGCDLLEGQTELSHFLENTDSETKRKKLIRLMGNRGEGRQADRYHFLPGALDLPDLLVDLRGLKTISREEFDQLAPVVSLDAPFAEALLAQFARYVGRLGTPDPDFDLVVQRLGASGAGADN